MVCLTHPRSYSLCSVWQRLAQVCLVCCPVAGLCPFFHVLPFFTQGWSSLVINWWYYVNTPGWGSVSWGFHGQSILGDLLTSPPSSLTRSGQGQQQYGASREDPSGECGTGVASSCQSSGQYLWGPDHGLDGECGHHCSQVRQPLFAPSLLLPEIVSLARETLTMS